MGFVGDLVGGVVGGAKSLVGGVLGGKTGANFQGQGAQIDRPLGALQGQEAQMQSLRALQNQDAFVKALNAQNGINNQSNVFNQMQGLANGTGPNPALAQLANTTGQNANMQAALMAGQRGAGANAGLLAREAAMQGGNIQQQAAGQAAALQSQQQLNALNQLGSIAGQQVNQQQTGILNQNQLRQNQQNTVNNQLNAQNQAGEQMQSNINSTNASVAAKNAETQGNLLGGALKGLGTAAATYFAGPVGGAVAKEVLKAHGGTIPNHSPQSFAAQYFSEGGQVPGLPQVFGDSEVNDVVPAKLSPGEIVIPRSILQGKNPVQMAAKFVEQELLKQHKSKKNNFADGGTAEDPAAAFYADRQKALEAKNPAFKSESVDNSAADFYAARNKDLSEGKPYKAGEITPPPIEMGTPGPLMASTSPAPTANTGGSLSGGEMSGASSQPQGLSNPGSSEAGLMNQALNEQLGGAKAEAKASTDLGMAQAAIEKQNQEKMASEQANYETNHNNLEMKRQEFEKRYEQGHVDPNRYLGDMSTGQKISTAIGLILGGMGSGITHQENPALQFLNSQIENDINAQKSELDKKQNLLSMNMRQFGNLDQATNMTRVMMATMADSKLKEAAAKAQDPLAKARLLQAQGQLHEKYAPIMQQMALKQTALQQGGGGDPSRLVPFLVPKDQQKEVFNEIKTAENANKVRSAMMSAFDKATKENTVLRTGAGYLRTPAPVLEMHAMALPLIHDLEGRVNEFEQKTVNDLMPRPGDTDSKISYKREALQRFIDQKASTPTARAHGINIPEAKASQEPQIQTKGGVKYQKVSGGWKRVG